MRHFPVNLFLDNNIAIHMEPPREVRYLLVLYVSIHLLMVKSYKHGAHIVVKLHSQVNLDEIKQY